MNEKPKISKKQNIDNEEVGRSLSNVFAFHTPFNPVECGLLLDSSDNYISFIDKSLQLDTCSSWQPLILTFAEELVTGKDWKSLIALPSQKRESKSEL